MRKLLHLLHAMLTAILLLWAGWTYVALGKAFINLFYLNRTVQIMFHRDLPEGNLAGSDVGWCIETNPEASPIDCPNLKTD